MSLVCGLSRVKQYSKQKWTIKHQHSRNTETGHTEERANVLTCLCDSSRCFMRTATTTLTRTNWAINTKMTKKMGAMICDTQQFLMQCSEWSQFSRSVSFMMPFQLSPVATRNSVKKAMPKFWKWACSPRPWHGCSSSHSANTKFDCSSCCANCRDTRGSSSSNWIVWPLQLRFIPRHVVKVSEIVVARKST